MKIKRQMSFYFAVFSLLWIALLYQNCAPQNIDETTITELGDGENPDDTRYVRALGSLLSSGFDMESTCGYLENYVCESLHVGPGLPNAAEVIRECISADGEQICLQVLENTRPDVIISSSYKCSIATVEIDGSFPFQGEGETLEEAFSNANDRCVSAFLSIQ